MKIKSIELEGFKRFKDLTIEQLPEKARLIVMVGPNGSGKSSVFEALYRYKLSRGNFTIHDDPYYVKIDSTEQVCRTRNIEFHTGEPKNRSEWEKSIHIRTPYRNDLAHSTDIGSHMPPITKVNRFDRIAENDAAVSLNYSRLVNEWIKRGTSRKQSGEDMDDVEKELYGELQSAIEELFRDPQLILTGLGSPQDSNIFEFDKGTSQGFSYENLSSGEKAALDLILDIIVAKSEFNDTVFCIDEPEAHMHTKLQGPLLKQLYKLIPDNSQLWIATHSIGMVRKAQDLWRENPDSVVFLDFGREDIDFDSEAIIIPEDSNPNLWERTYEIALGDLAKLIAPKQIVLCESTNFDADCYNAIFGVHYPDTRFVSIGNCEDVERANTDLIPVIEAVTGGAKVLRLRDRDEADDQEIEDNAKEGIRTLSHRNIESYLLDDEVLTKFCIDHDIHDTIQELLDVKRDALTKSIANGKAPDDLKDTAQGIHVFIRNAMRPRKIGNKSRSFMKNMLAHLIKPGMAVYEQLHKDIFGK